MKKLLSITFLVWMIGIMFGTASAQDAIPTVTPAQVRLVTPTPFIELLPPTPTTQGELLTPTLTQELVVIELIADVNARSSPELTDENVLGLVRAGERFNVLGKYFNWIQFQYDLAPDKRAWVYQDLVQIIGDATQIKEIDPFVEPTLDPLISGATQTREAILQDPNGLLTVTALERVIQLPGENAVVGGIGDVIESGTVLPTYTYPAGISRQLLTPSDPITSDNFTDQGSSNSDGVPPIILIVVLLGFGVLGLVITALR
ncbi:MAG: hypothetical protein ACOYLB_13495 [Phototrophicaceae bacterium]